MKKISTALLMALLSIGLASALPIGLAAQSVPDRPVTPTRPGPPTRDVTPDRPVDPKESTVPDKNPVAARERHSGESPLLNTLDQGMTQAVTNSLAAVREECAKYDPIYRIDCLRQGIQLTISRLPKTGDYAQARKILQKAATDLGRIVTANADPDQPLLLAPSGANPHFKKSRHYTAIQRENLDMAMNQAQAVMAEAETALLRSSENSARRQAHYQEIAIAVGSTKVLLRSS